MKDAQTRGADRELEFMKLEQRQLALRTETCKLQVEMAMLELTRAKTRLKRFRKVTSQTPPGKPIVRIEYIDELDALIVRGAKDDVKRIQKIIEELGGQ